MDPTLRPPSGSAQRQDIRRLPNLGPKSQAMLAAAGIETPAQLAALGAVRAYARVRSANAGVSLNLLWALEGALSGERWQDVARDHRTSLLLALELLDEAASAASRPQGPVARKRARRTP